jgi:protocatechuate 3,4-dioxygenase beta subunit
MERRLTRSGLLRLGGVLAAAFGLDALKSGWFAEEAAGGPAAVSSGAVTCVLAPEQTEGPYYVPNERLRRNITEGRPGRPLTLRLKVVDASTCRPIKGAAVDIWHCDALGVYSGVGGSPGNFMRGVQRTNAKGIATFQTVYPGWYAGRTVHIHVKVHVRGNVVHTGQLYFSDRLTDTVYRKAPYSRRPNRSTRNADDSIFRNGGKRSLLSLRRIRAGYLGRITMGVHRS